MSEEAKLKEWNARTIERGRRVVEAAEAKGVRVRLLGGCAISVRTTELQDWLASRRRFVHDLDFICRRQDRMALPDVMAELGYSENERLNALHGRTRQMYWGAEDEDRWEVDFFFDVLPMCHQLDMSRRLEHDAYTLPPIDLLLSKLQIVELNLKDVIDIAALLAVHPVSPEDNNRSIGAPRLARLVADDWGLHHTLERNLQMVRDYFPSLQLPSELEGVVRERTGELEAVLKDTPKTMRWRLRSRVGERVRWYQPVEDVTR